jgi:hypothetical protein
MERPPRIALAGLKGFGFATERRALSRANLRRENSMQRVLRLSESLAMRTRVQVRERSESTADILAERTQFEAAKTKGSSFNDAPIPTGRHGLLSLGLDDSR